MHAAIAWANQTHHTKSRQCTATRPIVLHTSLRFVDHGAHAELTTRMHQLDRRRQIDGKVPPALPSPPQVVAFQTVSTVSEADSAPAARPAVVPQRRTGTCRPVARVADCYVGCAAQRTPCHKHMTYHGYSDCVQQARRACCDSLHKHGMHEAVDPSAVRGDAIVAQAVLHCALS